MRAPLARGGLRGPPAAPPPHLNLMSLMLVMISLKKERGPGPSPSSNTLTALSQSADTRVSPSRMHPLLLL